MNVSAKLHVLLLSLLITVACQNQAPTSKTNIVSMLSTNSESGYSEAVVPNFLEFPRDHGSHPDYQTEWWYYTGNLVDNIGNQYGYQFTIFRSALSPVSVDDNDSTWRTNQIYAAHVAIIDAKNDNFWHSSRFSRGEASNEIEFVGRYSSQNRDSIQSISLAGARSLPYRVWLDNWSVSQIDDSAYRISAQFDNHNIDLVLQETQPIVVHGSNGISIKGANGEASYYYSMVGLQTTGRLTIDGASYEVLGKSWYDHEFMSNSMPPEAVGWDWFSAQFDNGHSLMFGHVRRKDGSVEPDPTGTWIDAESNVKYLKMADVQITVLDEWTSPETQFTYPSQWKITSSKIGLDVIVTPLINHAEMNMNDQIYWEGAATYEGTLNQDTISGMGYVELTGYY